MINKLTDKELSKITREISKIEDDMLYAWGLNKISGGFVSVDLFEYDNDTLDLQIKSGVENNCSSNIETESITMDRKTLKIVN